MKEQTLVTQRKRRTRTPNKTQNQEATTTEHMKKSKQRIARRKAMDERETQGTRMMNNRRTHANVEEEEGHKQETKKQ